MSTDTIDPPAAETSAPDVAAIRSGVLDCLTYHTGKAAQDATDRDWFVATALYVRCRIVERWLAQDRPGRAAGKTVYYLSLEFLIGRLMRDGLNNLGLEAGLKAALAELGVDYETVRAQEPDAALGNGGLGRLAACYMESMATLGVPAFGYGIRYNHGLFRQGIADGWQQEFPEAWLSFGNPWEFERPEISYGIGFGGHVEAAAGADRTRRHIWHPAETVTAIAFDTPVVGWQGKHVNVLRLWSARTTEPLSLEAFNRGDHVGAMASRARANAISQVLYPADDTPAGQELRLRQEFFFSSASLQDLIRRHLGAGHDIRTLAAHAAIQLNDTHPAIAIPELMRLLVDVHEIPWAEAWPITTACFSYTNHTLLPEALESWPLALMERLLPRHMQILYLINWLHLDGLRQAGESDTSLLNRVSLIDESAGRRVRMGTLAFLGSHKVNGVSALHTELMRRTVFSDLHTLHPGRITNVTNGITFRRWLLGANPQLTRLLNEVTGGDVLCEPDALERLARYSGDSALHDKLGAIRLEHKVSLARVIEERVGIRVDPRAMFDVHVKRMHEYKRQLLNILETVALYDSIRAQPLREWVPRVKIFAGKAAPGYVRAKLIIKLIHDVAAVINSDPTMRNLLKVVFLPNYNVSLAEAIMPAADLSEQISTAGMEASGTGNMKLALNGALTIGTLDGANVEIRERVGDENIFIFGLTAAEVEARKQERQGHGHAPWSPALNDVIAALGSGVYSPTDPGRFHPITRGLEENDTFMVADDFDLYLAAQRKVDRLWHDRAAWWKASALNTAHVGWFSSDRSIRDYAAEIWNVKVAP